MTSPPSAEAHARVRPPAAAWTAALSTPGGWTTLILVSKLVVCLPFSSDYADRLFLPFLSAFANGLLSGSWVNPWSLFLSDRPDAFPYHPAMLYLHSLSRLPALLIPGGALWDKFWFVLPSAVADGLILFTLLKFFPERRRAINVLYGLSPIPFYAIYLHGQLDLWPTALLFLSCYRLMRGGTFGAAVLVGVAVSMKLHVLAALPLMVIFLLRRSGPTAIARFGLGFVLCFGILSGPWYLDPSFQAMVLRNPKQDLIFQGVAQPGGHAVYPGILAVLLIYMRFFAYRRINAELFFSWMACLFAVFVLFVPPAPGWYVWLMPFLTYFFMKFVTNDRHMLYLSGFLSLAHLAYFLLAWRGDHLDLSFLGRALDSKPLAGKSAGLAFTLLQGALLANLLAIYRFGVRANTIYRRPGPILLGIGGDSGSGKSTLRHSLERLFGSSMTSMEGDAEHRWERGDANWEEYTHLNPRANFLKRQMEHLYRLKTGAAIQRSDYEHSTGRFTGPRWVRPADFVLLSGLHPFYLPRMRKLLDIKIFLDTDEDLRRHWKIQRDHVERGHSIASIEAQIQKRTRDAQRFIRPQRDFADMIVEYRPRTGLQQDKEVTALDLELRLTLQADLHIEDMVFRMEQEPWFREWDYLDNLRGQYFVFSGLPSADQIRAYAHRFVAGYNDILSSEPIWDEGYAGVVQLFVLVMVEHCLQEAPYDGTSL